MLQHGGSVTAEAGGKRTLSVARGTPCLFTVAPQASVQLRKALLQVSNIRRARSLKLPFIGLVNVRDLSGLDAFDEPHQPVSFLMPILGAHTASKFCHSCDSEESFARGEYYEFTFINTSDHFTGI